jgi:hypothetical protein
MKLHGLHQACAIALFAVAPIVAAQTSGTASGPTATTSGSDAVAPATNSKQSATSDMSRSHATKPHKHSMQMSGGSTQTMSHSDSAYHGALKRCVEGAADQRDGCIDQAIKQYGST